MKRNIYLASMLCGLIALSATSCDNPGEPQFENDEFTSVLYLRNSGQVEIEFYNVNEDVTFSTAIGKGGTNPAITRNATLTVFTQDEMDAYNKENATNFVMLSSDYYEFDKDHVFDKSTESQNVNITLKAGIGTLDHNKQYVLPLRLNSSEYSVKDDKSTLILLPKVFTPTVSLGTNGLLAPINFSIYDNTVTTAQCALTLNLDAANSKWNFALIYETDKEVLESKVAQFATESGKEYTLLPTENYTLPTTDFNAESNKEVYIEINRTGLSAGDYLLPVILKDITGMPFNVASDKICYVHVRVSNKITLNINDLYANSNENDQSLPAIINGSIDDNGWQSMWYAADLAKPICDPQYGIYIDIKNIKDISKIARLVLSIKTTHNNPKYIQFYAGSSENDLKLIHENENCFPDSGSKKVYDTGNLVTSKISMIRIALITNAKNNDMRTLEFYSGNYIYNVALSEIELYGE